jgi:hypothetical protein
MSNSAEFKTYSDEDDSDGYISSEDEDAVVVPTATESVSLKRRTEGLVGVETTAKVTRKRQRFSSTLSTALKSLLGESITIELKNDDGKTTYAVRNTRI